MKMKLLHAVPILAISAFFSLASSLPQQWKTAFQPPVGEMTRGMTFNAAIEMANGDFIVSGSGWNEHLIRMDSHGITRWAASSARNESGIQPREAVGLYQSGAALVVLRNYWDYGANNDAGTYLERYDDAGKVTSKIHVADSKWAFSGDGGVFSTESQASADSAGQPLLSLQKRMFDGSPGWSTVLGGFYRHEVIGILDRGHSDPVVLCAPLSKGLMDTVFAFGLDATGKIEWQTKFETGRNMDPITGHPAISWSTSTRLPGGRIAAAGMREAIKGVSPDSGKDSLLVLVWDPNYGNAFMYGTAIHPSDLEHEGGVWVSDLQPSGGNNFYVKVHFTIGNEASYREMEVNQYGRIEFSWPAPTKGRVNCCGHSMIFLPNHAYADFGYSIDSIGPEPPVYVYGTQYPTSVNTAAVFVGTFEGQGEWKTLELEEFRDTVWTSIIPNPHGGIRTYTTDFRSLNFLIRTSDGGALVGGRLWSIDSQDTATIAAIKLGPGYAVGLSPARKPRGSATRISGNITGKAVRLFDAMGRRQGSGVSAGLPVGGRFRN
jgi:hypothetical protein